MIGSQTTITTYGSPSTISTYTYPTYQSLHYIPFEEIGLFTSSRKVISIPSLVSIPAYTYPRVGSRSIYPYIWISNNYHYISIITIYTLHIHPSRSIPTDNILVIYILYMDLGGSSPNESEIHE